MQPIIGITTSLSEDESLLQMNRSYTEALASNGALPVLLPASTAKDAILQYAQMCNGLLLSGGDDVDPARYGEAQIWQCGAISPLRDSFEISLCREFLRLRKPILAICRGIQVLNVALGGTLYQDLQSELPGCIAHRQKQKPWYTSHAVEVAPGTQLADILGAGPVPANSHHHQSVKIPGDGLIISATAADGVVEAVEHSALPFCIGVQWHPERLWNQTDFTVHRKLFQAFVSACQAT